MKTPEEFEQGAQNLKEGKCMFCAECPLKNVERFSFGGADGGGGQLTATFAHARCEGLALYHAASINKTMEMGGGHNSYRFVINPNPDHES